MANVSISQKQKLKYMILGQKLINKKEITGFQLEDFNPHKQAQLTYGHDTQSHLDLIRTHIGGRAYPRESFYKWNPSWKAGENTTLYNNKRLAGAREQYIATKNKVKSVNWLSQNAVNRGTNFVAGSWYVPDVRIYAGENKKDFRKAWQVTKRIDHNSRFSTVITSSKRLRQVKRDLVGEKVKPVFISDYSPKRKNSLWTYIGLRSR